MSEKVISYHTFMFPFRWDRVSKQYTTEEEFFKKVSLEERIKIDDDFHQILTDCGWGYKKFDVSLSTTNYNEYFYFHSFVNRVLYNKNKQFKENQTSYYYEKLEFEGGNFEITLNLLNNNNKEKKIYNLEVDGVSLRVFETGIAIFSINLKNFSYKDSIDILKINDFGRRFYAQFLNESENKDHSEKTRESFLSESIKISDKNKKNTFENSFKYNDIPNEIEIAEYIINLLNGKKIDLKNKIDYIYSKSENIVIHPILDDRMFVLSYYQNKDVSNTLNIFSDNKYSYFQSDFWYKYLFVEWSDKTCQSKVLSKKLLEDSTYDRWIDYGTLFGMTRYSFVLIFSSYWSPLYEHFRTMYFQMFNLLLAQRASILRFSHEASLISDLKESEISAEKISSLYLHYMKFINKLWFREITAQEQGIEMYDLAVKQMRLKEEIEALDNEIKELNDFMTLQIENSRNKEAQNLNKIASLFLPATLLSGIFGMNIFEFRISITLQYILLSLFLCIFIYVNIPFILEYKKQIEDFFRKSTSIICSLNKIIYLITIKLMLIIFYILIIFIILFCININNLNSNENKSAISIEKTKANIGSKKDNKKESNHKAKQK